MVQQRLNDTIMKRHIQKQLGESLSQKIVALALVA